MKNDSQNNTEEFAVNIKYCPYCGGNVIERVNEVDMYCMDCGRDFKIMTHGYTMIEPYKQKNKDDINVAVKGLDIFTKNWCMNCNETNMPGIPVFNCNGCEFENDNGECLIKKFASNHKHGYPFDNFGSMGR